MTDARRHHYISQFYLRKFADELKTPQLLVTDLQKQKAFITSIVNVAQERDFHRVAVDGYEPNAVEMELAKLEAQASTILDRILAQGVIVDGEDAVLFLFYMALLFIKNPGTRSRVDDIVHQVATAISKAAAANPQHFAEKIKQMIKDGSMPVGTDPEELRTSISDAYTISASREMHLELEFENAGQLLPYFTGRRWTFLRAKSGNFITSDRPVVLTRQEKSTQPPGLSHRDVMILFPISSDAALLGSVDISIQAAELSADEVAQSNSQIIQWATRFVYAKNDSFQYQLADRRLLKAADLLNPDQTS